MADARPAVFLGMPHYDAITAGAMRAWACPTFGAVDLPLGAAEVGSSFLCGSFNDLFAFALDRRDEGKVTHFAMLHADVEPEVGWLDTLAAALAEYDLASLSAVIAIKQDTPDPPTSTAIGDRSDPWNSGRRLHVSDRRKTPSTFTAADVCGPGEVLLVNTGLWLADLRHPAWADFPGFDVHARIVRTPEGRKAQQRTEDWELSRWMDANGVPYGATWAAPVCHKGGRAWPNY